MYGTCASAGAVRNETGGWMGAIASPRGLGLLCLIVSACAAGAGDAGPDGSCQPGMAAACACPDGSV